MTDLPEEVRDLHQERVNALCLLFAGVPEEEQMKAVRSALTFGTLPHTDVDYLSIKASMIQHDLDSIYGALSVGSGAFPMGVLAGSRLQETIGRAVLMVREMQTVIGRIR